VCVVQVLVARVAISQGQRSLGTAIAGARDTTLRVSEFQDTEKYDGLASLFVQLSVSECVVQMDTSADAEFAKIRAVCERFNVPVRQHKASSVKNQVVSLEQDVGQLVGSGTEQYIEFFEKKLLVSALAGLIKFHEMLSNDAVHGQVTLVWHSLADYMTLGKTAIEALNVFPQASDNDKLMSLFGVSVCERERVCVCVNERVCVCECV
jgi:DNA mismatch repair ATPase MutS